jgi:hypothetical protein
LEWQLKNLLEALGLALGNVAHFVVHFSGRRAENQVANGVPRQRDVLVAAQNVNPGVGEHDARSGGVFNGVPGFTILAGDAADGPR